MIRRLANMVRWGSPAGPAISIDWDARTVTYHRLSVRLVRRLERWRAAG